MKPKIIKNARALLDLDERAEYIRKCNPRAALRFIDAAEATFGRLAAMPGLRARCEHEHPALADLRFLPRSHFKKDLVFYRPVEVGIAVLLVLHAARDLRSILAEEFGIDEDAADDERPNHEVQ